jgi:hypothetical protein
MLPGGIPATSHAIQANLTRGGRVSYVSLRGSAFLPLLHHAPKHVAEARLPGEGAAWG